MCPAASRCVSPAWSEHQELTGRVRGRGDRAGALLDVPDIVCQAAALVSPLPDVELLKAVFDRLVSGRVDADRSAPPGPGTASTAR